MSRAAGHLGRRTRGRREAGDEHASHVGDDPLGERVWADRDTVELPEQFRASRVPAVAQAIQVVGIAVLAYGLVRFDLLAAVTGTVLCQTAKLWYLDRMVLLFEDMKARRPEYAAWEYGPSGRERELDRACP